MFLAIRVFILNYSDFLAKINFIHGFPTALSSNVFFHLRRKFFVKGNIYIHFTLGLIIIKRKIDIVCLIYHPD